MSVFVLCITIHLLTKSYSYEYFDTAIPLDRAVISKRAVFIVNSLSVDISLFLSPLFEHYHEQWPLTNFQTTI